MKVATCKMYVQRRSLSSILSSPKVEGKDPVIIFSGIVKCVKAVNKPSSSGKVPRRPFRPKESSTYSSLSLQTPGFVVCLVVVTLALVPNVF